MIRVENICKSYYKKTAIDDVSLIVSPGEIQGLVGDNGAGKTTLIKCIAGIFKPEEGTVLYDDVCVYDNPSVKEKIGYVSDNNEYIGRYTIKKLIKLYQTYFPKFNLDKFEKLNSELKLPLNSKIEALSKGQKMRLGFMMEISKMPEYLLLDEPTSGLDPVAKKIFLEKLVDEVEKENIGVLISTHNLSDLEKLCDTITFLDKGKKVNASGLDDLKCGLTKLQAVFENGVDEKLLLRDSVLSFSKVGRIYTLIIRGYDENKEAWLKSIGAGYIEEIDMSLEELYIAINAGREKENEEVVEI